MVGCNVETLGYVRKAKYDTLQKQFEKAESDLKAAQQQVAGCRVCTNTGFTTKAFALGSWTW
jgi:hypothetical protein